MPFTPLSNLALVSLCSLIAFVAALKQHFLERADGPIYSSTSTSLRTSSLLDNSPSGSTRYSVNLPWITLPPQSKLVDIHHPLPS